MSNFKFIQKKGNNMRTPDENHQVAGHINKSDVKKNGKSFSASSYLTSIFCAVHFEEQNRERMAQMQTQNQRNRLSQFMTNGSKAQAFANRSQNNSTVIGLPTDVENDQRNIDIQYEHSDGEQVESNSGFAGEHGDGGERSSAFTESTRVGRIDDERRIFDDQR